MYRDEADHDCYQDKSNKVTRIGGWCGLDRVTLAAPEPQRCAPPASSAPSVSGFPGMVTEPTRQIGRAMKKFWYPAAGCLALAVAAAS
jgi:hypothetical protein